MSKTPIVAARWMLVIVLFTPASAFAQIVPSPPWGEPINTTDRFVLLASYNNEAVYDQETGLVWEQAPNTASRIWLIAQFHCITNTVGNRKGWRLPTIQELASLIDPTQANPALPAGHPFSNVQPSGYWSASSLDASSAWLVDFGSGPVDFGVKSFPLVVWCVRGGQGVDPQ